MDKMAPMTEDIAVTSSHHLGLCALQTTSFVILTTVGSLFEEAAIAPATITPMATTPQTGIMNGTFCSP